MAHRVRRVLMLVGLGMLAACAPLKTEQTQIQGVEDDQFQSYVMINGAAQYQWIQRVAEYRWYLRTLIDKKTHAVERQIYVRVIYFPPKSNFNGATDDTARDLPVQKLYFQRNTCSPHFCGDEEDFVVIVDDATLKGRVQTGYPVKLWAQDGMTYVLAITPQMIRLQLDAEALSMQSLGPPISEAPAATTQTAATTSEFGASVAPLPANHAVVRRDPKLKGKGVVITAIARYSPAFLAALKIGDVIVSYDGRPVANEAEMNAAIAASGTGRKIPVEILLLPLGTNVGRTTIWVQM